MKDYIGQNVSLGYDWRVSRKLALLFSASYGVTFLYLDNVPRKIQVVPAVRWAPFAASRRAMLRNLRAEISFLFIHFPDAGKSLAGPMIYLYWQWK